jgi:hypothetical protein
MDYNTIIIIILIVLLLYTYYLYYKASNPKDILVGTPGQMRRYGVNLLNEGMASCKEYATKNNLDFATVQDRDSTRNTRVYNECWVGQPKDALKPMGYLNL